MEFTQIHPALLAVAIFAARILDVSIGTLRTLIVFRGHQFLAAALGFCEVLIWLAAAAQVFQNLDRWYLAVAYAAGFAAGNIVGMQLEGRLGLGSELIRVISHDPTIDLTERLRERGYDVTALAAEGTGGVAVEVLLLVEKRRHVPELLALIQATDPAAVWTITDVKRHPATILHGNRKGPASRPVRPDTKRK